MSITSAGEITSAKGSYTDPGHTITLLVTWTNLGPLTTTFRAPASCSNVPTSELIVHDYRTPESGLIESGICQVYNRKVPPWVDCQPSGSIFSPLYTVPYWTSYFSPGIYCPAGYLTAAAFVLASPNVSAVPLGINTLRTTGTHVFCCPSDFTSSDYRCWSSVSTATSTSLCGDDTCAKAWTTTTFSDGRREPTCPLYTPAPFLWDPSQQAVVTVQAALSPVYMIHQQSDIPTPIPRNGLPTTDKIVTGVIVPVVVLFAVFVGGFCFMRRSKKRSQSKSNAQPAVGLQAVERREYPKRPVTSKRNWHLV